VYDSHVESKENKQALVTLFAPKFSLVSQAS